MNDENMDATMIAITMILNDANNDAIEKQTQQYQQILHNTRQYIPIQYHTRE